MGEHAPHQPQQPYRPPPLTGDVLDQVGRVVRPTSAPPAATVPPQWHPPGMPPPTLPPPPTRRRRRGWRWALGVVLVLGLCLGVPAAGLFVWIGLPILRETVDAGKGAAQPNEALYRFLFTFAADDLNNGDFIAHRYVVKSRQEKVLKVRSDFIKARQEWKNAHPDAPVGDMKMSFPQEGDPPEQYGDPFSKRTNVLMYVEWEYTLNDDAGRTMYVHGGGLAWKAEAVKERDGWRLWSLEIPPWCGIEGDIKSGYCACNR